MSLFAIGIGGTGSKCLESLTHLASVGLLETVNHNIYTLFVDPDETNGNLERSRVVLSRSQRCYELFERGNVGLPWMHIRTHSLGLWSPFGQLTTDKRLDAFFGYDSLKHSAPELGGLFDVLFTPEERESTLDVGFRGRPTISAAVMSQVDLHNLDEEVWRQLIERIRNDVGSGAQPRIMLFGSVFGGTGASGLPTIGRLLDQKLQAENLRQRVSIASAFLLPYFRFTPSGNLSSEEVHAHADQFLMDTEAALRYYLTQSQPFDIVYLLGSPNQSEVEFSLGKQTQRNPPHYIELYAGLAARHFINQRTIARNTMVSLISRESSEEITWKDLPEEEIVKERLSTAVRFAYVWLSNIEPELDRAKEVGVRRFQSEAPWFNRFFQPNVIGLGKLLNLSREELPDFNDQKEQQAVTIVSDWCQSFLQWMIAIHQRRDESIELFRSDILIRLLNNKAASSSVDELSQLVIGTELDSSRLLQDTLSNLKLRLDAQLIANENKGVVGLAQSIYLLCKL